jgi:glycosyltransferase involved in cell wall biosynthesis
MNMKILLLNDYGTPTGGAEHQILALREGLRERGHEARLFASRAKYVAGESVADYHCYGTSSRLQPLIMAVNPSAYWNLRRVMTAFRPDVVHVNMFMWQLSPLILPLLRDIPSVHHVQMYNAICPRGTKMLPDGSACRSLAGSACRSSGCFSWRAWLPMMLQMKLWRRWRKAFNSVVAVSEAVRERMAADGIEADRVIWNGIPPQRFRETALAHIPTAVFAGRLVKEKGVDVLLRAFAKTLRQVPQARLLLAGEGAERDSAIYLISHLGIEPSVTLTGHVDRVELERRFTGAWVQAVPGRWEEPFGLVTAEAMMRGTAVVASASGAQTELVSDRCSGFLVPPGDVDALSGALTQLLSNRELAGRMGLAGREISFRNFTESASVDKFLELYESLLKNRQKSNGNG